MPPLPPAANVLKLQLAWIAGNSKGANVYHIKYAGSAPSVATLQSIASSANTSFLARFGALLHTAFAMKSYIITDLTSNTGNRAEGSLSGSGSASGTIFPGQVAAVVSWSINLRYRGGHPRTYLGGFPTSQAADTQTWGSGFITAMGTAAAGFISDINALTAGGNTYQLGSVQYWNHGAHPPALLANPVFLPYSTGVLHPRIDTQRRRLGKESF